MEGWPVDLRLSTLAVYGTDGAVAGAAFLLADGWIVTCAHVVAAGETPGEPVPVAFVQLPGERLLARADPQLWRSPHQQDVAFLRIDGPLPATAQPLALGAATGARGHRVVSFGFPLGAPRAGHYGYGTVGEEIIGDANVPQVQLTDCAEVTEGFSGGPVVDQQTGLVIGMVDSVSAPDRLGRGTTTAYVTPAETLRAINPGLRLVEVCPYLGLDAFAFEHASWFRGRGDDVDELVASLRQDRRVLMLLGPSGSGKSSLVHAGLLPRLAAEGLPGSDRWGWITARPAGDPYAQLIASGLAGAAPGELYAALTDWVQEHPAHDRVVLILDQFEELLVQTSEEQRSRLLVDLVDVLGRSAPVTVGLVMRDDFYSRLAAAAPGLMRSVERALVNIPATVSLRSLAAIVAEPAAAVGLTLQPQLTERIVADAVAAAPPPGGQPGAAAATTVLPLLEFALTELWRRRRDGQLTHAEYDAIGRVTGGLTAWCDRAYAALPVQRQPLARRILTALVTPGEEAAGIPPVRRSRTRQELYAAEDPAAGPGVASPSPAVAAGVGGEDVDAVLDALADARLVVTRRDAITGTGTLELIHDALIREWGALGEWLANDRDYRAWHARIEHQHREWQDSNDDGSGGDPDLLLRGGALEQALQQSERRPLRPELADLIRRSDHEQRRRLARDRRRTRVLAALLAISLAVSAVAVVLNNRAQTQSRMARSAAHAVQSSALLAQQPDLAHLLGLESLRNAPTLGSYTNLQRALARPLRLSHVLAEQVWVGELAFSPDGRLLAAAGSDGTVWLWDPATGRPVGEPLTGHTGTVNGVAFSPDGQLLASASHDRTVRLWDPLTGQPVGDPLTGHTDRVNGVAFSPDGQLLASAGDDRTVRLWDPLSGLPVGDTLTGHTDVVNGVAFSPDGQVLASHGFDETVRFWDLATGQPGRDSLTGTETVVAIAFSPDAHLLASANLQGTLRLWDPLTGQPVGEALTGHTDWVNGVAFSPDGQLLASASEDRTLRLWDPLTGQPVGEPLTGHTDTVNRVAFSPDGQLLASSSADGTVRLWDSVPDQPVGVLLTGIEPMKASTLSPDWRLLAGVGFAETVQFWDLTTGELVGDLLPDDGDTVNRVAFSPDGQLLASADSGGTVRLWDPASGQPVEEPLTGHTDAVNRVAFSPDGQLLASASDDRTVRLWDPLTGQAVGDPLTGHTDWVDGLAFSPDGQLLASAGDDHTVRLWNPLTGQAVGDPLTGHTSWVNAVVFSPDGQLLASGGDDGTVRLWDPATGQAVRDPLTGHTDPVNGLAFSPDGQLLASAGDDHTVRLWDPLTGQPVGDPLTGHTDWVMAVAFSLEDQLLSSISADGTMRLWAAAASWAERACERAGRNLTRDEWERYIGQGTYVRHCSRYPAGLGADADAPIAAYPDPLDAYLGRRGSTRPDS